MAFRGQRRADSCEQGPGSLLPSGPVWFVTSGTGSITALKGGNLTLKGGSGLSVREGRFINMKTLVT